jgi:surface antigen
VHTERRQRAERLGASKSASKQAGFASFATAKLRDVRAINHGAKTSRHAPKPRGVGIHEKNYQSYISSLSPALAFRVGFMALAFSFFVVLVPSSGVSPFSAPILNADGTKEEVLFENVVSLSGDWGSLEFPAAEAIEREELAAASRSEVRTDFSSDSSYGYAVNSDTPLAGGNSYAPGNCTWYAYNRRVEMGLPVAGNWGNANTWEWSASAAGYRVDHNPQVGDVISMPGESWYGHVAVVEEIGANNSVRISEMNVLGIYVESERWISNATAYSYIH